MVRYVGRPGPSPVVAALHAAGVLRPGRRILDVGCGTGTDLLALASWGHRRLTGLDREAEDLEVARRRAASLGLADRVRFLEGEATRRHAEVPDRSVDVQLDTLCWNNVHAESPARSAHYARRAWERLAPGGLLVMTVREGETRVGEVDPAEALTPAFAHRFDLRAVGTELPEWRWTRDRRGRSFTPVTVVAGRRRARVRG